MIHHYDSCVLVIKDTFVGSDEEVLDNFSEQYELVTEMDDPYKMEAVETDAASDQDSLNEGDVVCKLTVAKKRFLEEVSSALFCVYINTNFCYN